MNFPVVHYSNILILIFAGFLLESGFTVEPSVISGFDFDQRMIFTDSNNNNNPFFNYINFDPKDNSRIYIGAVDFLYRLNAGNISTQSTKSDNLTSVNVYSDILNSSLRTCLSLQRNANPNYRCRNHVRAAFPIQNEIYICATGAYNPQEFYIDYESLKFVALGLQDPSVVGFAGVTKCPSDPDAPYTVLYVDRFRGTPNNMSAIYSSINSDFASAMYRSPMQWNRTSPVQVSGLKMLLPDVTFVASFEIGQYVYYFYREIADEASGIGPVRYSRVARVCKNDYGNTLDRGKFLTFVKATLNCSAGMGSDIPVYYNNLYDVWYDASSQVFYGLFMASQNGSWGSAVCQYSYTNVVNKFDNGQFFSQETPSSLWTITSDEKVPNPRPSLCQANDTRKLLTSDQAFALTHFLMAGTIDQTTTTPLFYNRDIGYNRLTVDVVQGFGRSFTIFCLYSDKRPDEIVRVVQWTVNGVVSSRVFSVLKPFDDNKSMLREMTLSNSSGKSWLYIVKDTAVFQISMDVCSQYKLCTGCVIDPYCGWNSSSNLCVPYATGLIQNVLSPSALTACSGVCKVSSSSEQFCIPGMAVHLNCLSHCSPEENVVWTFPNGSVVQTDDPNYIITPSGGLVILNLTSDLNGDFTCMSNQIVLVEHTIKSSTCKYSENIQNIVAMEYTNWCKAFEQYKTEYNAWLCTRPDTCTRYTFCKCTNS